MNKKLGFFEIIAVAIILIIVLFVLMPICFHGNAIEQARTATFKGKCRGIWVAIMSANNERELLGQSPFFPGDLANQGITFPNAEAYFTYLMSDGTNTQSITKKFDNCLVPDLRPEMIAAPGLMRANKGAPVLPQNNPWHVVNVATNFFAETPFLVTRNVKASAITYPTLPELENKEKALLPIDQNLILRKRIVWMNLGGGTFDERFDKFTRPQLCPIPQPPGAPELTVLPSEDGYH